MKEEYDFSDARRGAVAPTPPGQTRITVRLDDDVLSWFRTRVNELGGGDYQRLINDALRQHILEQREPWEETLRRVFREEMQRAA